MAKSQASQAALEYSDAAGFPEDAETQVLVLIQKAEDPPLLYRLDLTEKLAAQFREVARAWVRRDVQSRSLVPYSEGRVPDQSEVVWLPRTGAPLLISIEHYLAHPEDLELLDPTSPTLRFARLFIVKVARPNNVAQYFFGPLGPKARLARRERLIAIFAEGTFDSIQQEVLIFDRTFDATLVDQIFLITKQGSFERLFGLISVMRAVAETALKEVTKNLKIQNATELESVVGRDLNMVRKLRSIGTKLDGKPAYAAAMSMANLLKFLDARPEIEVDIVGSGSSRQLVFHNDPRRRWRILKLLDDDYLQSPLTEVQYESNSKSVLGE
jgi:Domain of unknown function (DUF4868)